MRECICKCILDNTIEACNICDCYDVFIYSGGKTGSSTLFSTFIRNKFRSIHLHSNLYFKERYKKQYNVYDIINLSCKEKDKVYVIESYRTPIEREISSLFQNISSHIPEYKNLSLKDIINIFNKKYLSNLENYDSADEVFNHFNIPFITEFDFDKGYTKVEKDNLFLVKILFKDIKKWDKILSEVFQKEIKLYPENITEQKEIAQLYKEFKKEYRLPKEYLEHIKNNKDFCIYNTKEDQEAYLNYWRDLSI